MWIHNTEFELLSYRVLYLDLFQKKEVSANMYRRYSTVREFRSTCMDFVRYASFLLILVFGNCPIRYSYRNTTGTSRYKKQSLHKSSTSDHEKTTRHYVENSVDAISSFRHP